MNTNRYAQRPSRMPPSFAQRTIEVEETTRTEMFAAMHQMRHFASAVNKFFLLGLIRGSTHVSTGMEAIAAGFGAAMRSDDYTLATYRGHAHTLARGVKPHTALAELIGRDTGLLNGKGGSMHLTDIDHNMLGSFAIVGAHLPIACGVAWSAKLRGTDQVTICFFGDGATNIGAFHEALNLAAVWKLPIIFVCENNLYMEYSPIDLVTSVEHPAADRAAAYGLARHVIDGNDADVVYEFASNALEFARSGQGPVLVEAMTYRHGGHSRADPGDYRPPQEVATWIEYDPIKIYHQRLLSLGVTEQKLVSIERQVADEIIAATTFAMDSEFPNESVASADLWADGTSEWKRVDSD
ncbi:MAG: thiamine pyrophosphate-dependent dehydrogenase E1 component subunit alpha [Actinomycetota bacterium]